MVKAGLQTRLYALGYQLRDGAAQALRVEGTRAATTPHRGTSEGPPLFETYGRSSADGSPLSTGVATPHLSKTAKAALVIVGLLLAMSVGYASFEIREFPSALFGGQ